MPDKKYNPEDFILKEGDASNPREAVIEQSNITSSFTMGAVEDHKVDLLKMQKEMSAQVSLCQGMMDNITRNHPTISDLTEEQIHHVWMYKENFDVQKKAAAQLEKVEEQLAKYDEIIDIVYGKFGFIKTDVSSFKDEETPEDKKE